MEKTGAKKGEFIKELLKDFLVAIVIVFLITLVIKPTIVKETSMLDTLQPNNYLILNKLAYVGDRSPERGDIIVFRGHVGIAMGDGTMIDASSGNGRVIHRSCMGDWSKRNFICAWRIF